MTDPTSFRNLGVGVDGLTPPTEFAQLTRAAEALGFHSFWLSEGYHSRSAIVRAAIIATSTSRMQIGLGIVSPHTKHPSLLAMEAASLDEAAHGRLILGIGKVKSALQKHGLGEAGTIRIVNESIELVRGFLSGKLVRYNGVTFKIAEPGSELGFTPYRRDLPIYVGATGPMTLKLAGQYADGVLFNYPCTPSFIKYAMPFIVEGLGRSGKTLENFTVAAYLLVSVDEDEKKAMETAKAFVAARLPSRHPLMLQHAGVRVDEVNFVEESVKRLGLTKAATELDAQLVRKVALAGTPDQVIDGLREFRGSGLDLPIVWNIIGPDRRRSLNLLARYVMPKIL